ncbi:MAG: protein-disulfide reductase DsbD [Burkholderiales bacterium]|nr:protein-disulfide reductase DsbD [Burkholderiales bacterium]
MNAFFDRVRTGSIGRGCARRLPGVPGAFLRRSSSRLLGFAFFLLLARVLQAADPGDLLEPDKAFRLSARALDSGTVELNYRIAEGYYLYRDRFGFSADPAQVRFGAPRFEQGQKHSDQFFGESIIYRGQTRILLPVEGGSPQRFQLKVTAQGCADIGVCYVPFDQGARISLAAAGAGDATADLFSSLGLGSASRPGAASRFAGAAPEPSGSETAFVSLLESGRLWMALGVFFVAGIALAFTPCVLPMVPILSGIIVGGSRRPTRRRVIGLSLAYVAGMAVTYTAIGVGAALSGQLLSAALQNPLVLFAFAFVFVLLALSMFGFYELRLPSGLHARMIGASNRLPGGQFGGVALMGVLSAAIVSPCVAAPLAGALLYISQTRDVWLGGGALLSMALGMGVPLLIVGATEGALLPRSGAWMTAVKKAFGVLLLGVAVWIVSPVIPVTAQMLAWGALLIGSAMFLRAIDPLPQNAPGWSRFWKGAGVMALVIGSAMVVGALAGSRDPLAPLSGLLAGTAAQRPLPAFEPVANLAGLESRVKTAGAPVLLDFYAEWCVACKEMERYTFSDPRVRERLADFTLLRADVTAGNPQDRDLLKRFRLFGPPGIVFFDRAGREMQGVRVIGYQNAERFLQTLDAAAKQ